MKKISSSTVFLKKVFPIIWFGMLAVIAIPTYLGSSKPPLIFYVMPLLMAVFGFFLIKKLIWDLCDEVYDHGTHLEFHKNGKTQTVLLNDIMNINYTKITSPERVEIIVRKDGDIGKELVFSLPTRFNPFSKSTVITELMERVDNARRT